MNGIAPFQPKRRRLKLSWRRKHEIVDGAMHERSIVTTVCIERPIGAGTTYLCQAVEADEVISVNPRGTAALFN